MAVQRKLTRKCFYCWKIFQISISLLRGEGAGETIADISPGVFNKTRWYFIFSEYSSNFNIFQVNLENFKKFRRRKIKGISFLWHRYCWAFPLVKIPCLWHGERQEMCFFDSINSKLNAFKSLIDNNDGLPGLRRCQDWQAAGEKLFYI